MTGLPCASFEVYAHQLGLSPTDKFFWCADGSGVHLKASPGVQLETRHVSPALLTRMHTDLLSTLSTMTTGLWCSDIFLYMQLQYLLNPVQLPSLVGHLHWIGAIDSMDWQPNASIATLGGWTYDVDTVRSLVTRCAKRAFNVSTATLDALSPGWQTRYTTALTLGLVPTDADFIRYVCAEPPALTTSPLPDLGVN